ncbi:hypothetical protein [Streptomyces sp. NPDC001165]|uniref:hypothetical protein n=1 Tax=Streptomyces sp. NPDC001165 TaxID=3364546 RepID=UPI00367E3C56
MTTPWRRLRTWWALGSRSWQILVCCTIGLLPALVLSLTRPVQTSTVLGRTLWWGSGTLAVASLLTAGAVLAWAQMSEQGIYSPAWYRKTVREAGQSHHR